MKVRIKHLGIVRPVEVGDGDSCTLAQLRDRIAELFVISEPFSLSLNRADPLSGDEQTLAELGIVSGDLVYVNSINTDPVSPTSPSSLLETSAPSPSASSTSSVGVSAEFQALGMSDQGTSMEADDGMQGVEGHLQDTASSTSQTENMPAEPSTSGETAHSEAGAGATAAPQRAQASSSGIGTQSKVLTRKRKMDGALERPLLVRESTSKFLPEALRKLYASAECTKKEDALWVAVHAVIMEVGFRPVQTEHLSMGADWNKAGFYKQIYTNNAIQENLSSTIVGVSMQGPTLLVHGISNEGEQRFSTERLPLRVSDYVTEVRSDVLGVFFNLERLSRFVKDFICQPLLAHFGFVCRVPVPGSLLSLTDELKLKLLSYLPVESLVKVGQVCKLLSNLYKDPELWRNMYLRDFPNVSSYGNTNLNKDWYELYKKEYYSTRERRKAQKLKYQVVTGVPPWLNPRPGHFPPLIPPPMPAGIVGGDYDINPEFISSIPHPLFGHPSLPGPSAVGPRFDDPFRPAPDPFRPAPDPFRPGPSQQFMSGSRTRIGRAPPPSPFNR